MTDPGKSPHGQLPPSPPDTDALRDAALTYLARYAATQAGLLRVLQRRIDRWAHQAQGSELDRDTVTAQVAAAAAAAQDVVRRLAAAGAINDAAFAESKVRSLERAGRSRRAIGAHLAAKGVDPETQRHALPAADPDNELPAALILARRRRIGPFRAGDPPEAEGRRRELAILARAGFPQDVAQRALALDPEEAETLVNQLRR
jgi:regulatory protein